MYIQGHRQYNYHVKTYGHPSKFGYKDVIPTWKAENFDPDYLLGLYRKAGAKFFVSMGVHHDNFDLWNSKHQPRWNAVATGPKKNIAQMFKDAAVKQGLRFGVSQHLHASYEWMATCFGSDKTGPLAGVPYDGNDPQYADLYHEKHAPAAQPGDVSKVPESWKQQYLLRLQDLIDQLQPDLMYHDGVIRFEQYGLKLVAHLYNQSAKWHGGKVEAVYTCKGMEDCQEGTAVLDFERGIAEGIWPNPFQTDTCVADWHYDREARYRTPKQCIDLLVNIVSRNGTLLLNFPLKSDGTLDSDGDGNPLRNHGVDGRQQRRHPRHPPLEDLRRRPQRGGHRHGTPAFQAVAGHPGHIAGRHAIRRFARQRQQAVHGAGCAIHDQGRRALRLSDGLAGQGSVIPSLATTARPGVGKIQNVELLGAGKVPFTQDATALKVHLPESRPAIMPSRSKSLTATHTQLKVMRIPMVY